MALYHLTAKTGTRATGASALAKAQYIQREARYARVPDAVVYTASCNLPAFAGGNAAAYWDAADLYERSNARLFKEVEFALPIELPPAEQRQLAESFAAELTAGEKLPYTLAIHEGRGHNPHCHVLLSERVNDGIERPASQWFRRWNERSPEDGGARKSRALHPRAWLEAIREKWAELVNRALERAGVRERVDHRSLSAQGAERAPQIHLGANVLRMKQRGLGTDRADQAQRIAAHNRALAERPAPAQRGPADNAQGADGSASDSAKRASPTSAPTHSAASREERAVPHRSPSLGSSPTSPDAEAHLPHRSSPSAERSERHAATDPRPLGGAAGGPWSSGNTTSTPSQHSSPVDRTTANPAQLQSRDAQRSPGTLISSPPAPSEPRANRGLDHETQGHGTPNPQDRPARPPLDRTTRAVARQLRAMGCALFEVGIHDGASGQMLNRTWSQPEILDRLPWLKHMNAAGRDVYIRPAAQSPGHGLVLLDDLTHTALRALERDGRTPALVVETSPENHQAWVRLPDRATDEERTEVAQRLAREYDADSASASPQQYGRLAGFTNRKPAHRNAQGLQPFAILRRARGLEAHGCEALLREAREALTARARLSERAATPELPPPPREPSPEATREATDAYRQHMRELLQMMNDVSRCDFSAAIRLAAAGYAPATIEQAVRTASPNLEERKRGHVEDYVRRTVEAAVDAQARRLERERSLDRDRDGDLER